METLFAKPSLSSVWRLFLADRTYCHWIHYALSEEEIKKEANDSKNHLPLSHVKSFFEWHARQVLVRTLFQMRKGKVGLLLAFQVRPK